MVTFKKINSETNPKEVIKSAFDTTLPIDGGWGYTKELATIINKTDIPTGQLEHQIASMRAYIEMSMTRPKEDRYGGINLNESDRQEHQEGSQIWHKVTYDISAMREDQYDLFIGEYKDGYGKDEFDLSEHFKKRKEATIHREAIYWFKIDIQ